MAAAARAESTRGESKHMREAASVKGIRLTGVCCAPPQLAPWRVSCAAAARGCLPRLPMQEGVRAPATSQAQSAPRPGILQVSAAGSLHIIIDQDASSVSVCARVCVGQASAACLLLARAHQTLCRSPCACRHTARWDAEPSMGHSRPIRGEKGTSDGESKQRAVEARRTT